MILGITGGIGTGKSSVLKILQELGIETISADLTAREVSKKGTAAFNKIIETFGKSILDEDENIDRRKLGKIVFDNETSRKKLEDILHPEIISIINEKIVEFKKNNLLKKTLAVEVPLLYECRMQKIFDKVLVVSAEPEYQLSRLNLLGLSESDAKNRISAQMPLKKKREMADFVIENNSSLPLLKEKVKEIIEKIAEVG